MPDTSSPRRTLGPPLYLRAVGLDRQVAEQGRGVNERDRAG